MYAQLAAFLLGVWLTAAPDVLGFGDPAAVERPHRRPAGRHVAADRRVPGDAAGAVGQPAARGRGCSLAPWVLGYAAWPETAKSVAVGLGVAGLARSGGGPERFGGGWSALWRRTEPWPGGRR